MRSLTQSVDRNYFEPMNTETAVSELPATELEAIKQRCEKATPGPIGIERFIAHIDRVEAERDTLTAELASAKAELAIVKGETIL